MDLIIYFFVAEILLCTERVKWIEIVLFDAHENGEKNLRSILHTSLKVGQLYHRVTKLRSTGYTFIKMDL
jgi:hypothetical protein